MDKLPSKKLTNNERVLLSLAGIHIDRSNDPKDIPLLPVGASAMVGPSKSGKTYTLQKMMFRGFYRFINRQRYKRWNRIYIVTANLGTGEGWRQFFLRYFGEVVYVINVDELLEVYNDGAFRAQECRRTHVSFAHNLIIFDDTSRITDPSLKEQRQIKYNPVVTTLCQNGRNNGFDSVCLFQDFPDVPMAVWNNCYLIMFAAPENINDRKNHAYPKILDGALSALPDSISTLTDTQRYAFFNRELNNMNLHEFVVKLKYEEGNKLKIKLYIFKA